MVQSPSWKANWFAASQEIPCISQNLKIHYRTHKRPPPVSILGQPNPVHIPTFHLLEFHPNIIHPSTPRSPQWFLPTGFPTKILYTPLLTHTRHMPSPSHSSRFYRPRWGVQIIYSDETTGLKTEERRFDSQLGWFRTSPAPKVLSAHKQSGQGVWLSNQLH